MNIKIKLNFFSHNKLNFQPRTLNCSVQCKCENELFCIVNGEE